MGVLLAAAVLAVCPWLAAAQGAPARNGQAGLAGAADCAPLLSNGDFEGGPGEAWSEESGSGDTLVSTQWPRTGSYGAWLGGYEMGDDTLSQAIDIPESAGSVTLVYWWAIHTQEETHPHDLCTVELRGPDGAAVATLQTITDEAEPDVWQRAEFDLSPYRGQRLVLAFHALNDYAGPTDFFLDDVDVRVCSPAGHGIHLPCIMRMHIR